MTFEDSFFDRLFDENFPPERESHFETMSSFTEVTVGSLLIGYPFTGEDLKFHRSSESSLSELLETVPDDFNSSTSSIVNGFCGLDFSFSWDIF